MPWLFGSKKRTNTPKVGEWVEDVREIDYGYGRTGKNYMGTYHWEGPEPATGRPPNPAETPEGMARLQQIRNSKAREIANANASNAMLRQQRADKAEEDRVCRAAIAELRARRVASGGGKKTRKNRRQN